MSKGKNFQLLLFFVPVLCWVLARWLFDYNGLYGQDAHRYFQFTSELKAYLIEGRKPGEFHWPLYFPAFSLLISILPGVSTDVAMQVVSVLSHSLTAVFLFRMLDTLYPNHRKKLFTLILMFFLFSPQVLIASLNSMSDANAMLWVVLCWYFFFKWKRERNELSWILSALFSSLATFTRYPMAPLVVIPVLAMAAGFLKEKPIRLIGLIVIIGLVALPNYLILSPNARVSGNYYLANWSISNFFQNDFHTHDGYHHYRLWNLLYISFPLWHPAFFFPGVFVAASLLLTKTSIKVPWILVCASLLYLLLLAGLPVQGRRFLVPVFPLLFLIPATGMLLMKARFAPFLVVGSLIVQLSIFSYYALPHLKTNRFEKELAAYMEDYEGRVLHSFYWDGALKSYSLDFVYKNLWEHRVDSLNSGDLILFNEKELQEQWKGSLLLENWERISRDYHLLHVNEWSNGWSLYEVR